MVHEIRTYAYVYTLGYVRLGFVVGRHPKKSSSYYTAVSVICFEVETK